MIPVVGRKCAKMYAVSVPTIALILLYKFFSSTY